MDAVEDIKQRLSIEDVLSEYVQLKRAGRNFKGLSPFSAEKTPSFVVSPEKQIWHDFSSNRGGDMFSFVMEVEGLDFKGALELLARKAGIDLAQYQTGRSDDGKKERLYALVELATKFYQAQFRASKLALTYVLSTRVFSKETALEWRLGYAPNNGSALVDFAKSKGYSPQELQQAGLTNRYAGDLFKGRLMIPLCDSSGRVIGFTARILDESDSKAPKYINTPATALYDKSRHVFGLHLAKESIRKVGFVVLAEGNLDVIASHQAGVLQCVATAGTALTEFQLKALGRFTPDIRLSFDADRAGIAATERAIPIAARVGVNLSVITVPSGKDPDELIRSDKKLWESVITQPQYAIDWLIEKYQRQLDLTSSLGKRDFSDTVFAVIRGLEDAVQREHYVQRVANIIGVNSEALRTKLDTPTERPRLKQSKQTESPAAEQNIDALRAEHRLLALMLLQPKLRPTLQDIDPDYLVHQDAKALFAFLKQTPDFDGDPKHVAALRPIENYVKIATLQYEELYQGLDILELQYEIERLLSQLVEQYVKTQKQQISFALQEANESQTRELLTKAKQLDTVLKKYKRGI